MNLSLSTLLALATAPVLIFAAPYIEIDIKESPQSQSQAPFHDLADQCQPEKALINESPFKLPCCEGYRCDSSPTGKCVPTPEIGTGISNDKGVSAVDNSDVHAMCQIEGELCQLVPIPLLCCGSLVCSNLVSSTCVMK
jgi:hypothetical protein